MPSLGEAPSVGARALLVTFGWAGIPGSFPKVTRRKGGTITRHHLNNGYSHRPPYATRSKAYRFTGTGNPKCPRNVL